MCESREQKAQKEDNMVTHGNSSKICECLACTISLYVKLHSVCFGSDFHLVRKYGFLPHARSKFKKQHGPKKGLPQV